MLTFKPKYRIIKKEPLSGGIEFWQIEKKHWLYGWEYFKSFTCLSNNHEDLERALNKTLNPPEPLIIYL